ncbi:PREDICTED: uncharacterized protein LOC109171321 isoform X2 [Ipomoea nil]|uniref:uncharacterized protein LOC109171321 isoform X2 n=1 Tax=Ipomoea nil TaxID=35883 RepID=UPI0009009487|nr:PREDICTED: uncharacterized protein LOC109171321 isoform X2 [Ipomoea nil]XP_019175944.1 PREDICTED: uncharacterized protein LOC109171321 isoform X2 [Ipomoea nil]
MPFSCITTSISLNINTLPLDLQVWWRSRSMVLYGGRRPGRSMVRLWRPSSGKKHGASWRPSSRNLQKHGASTLISNSKTLSGPSTSSRPGGERSRSEGERSRSGGERTRSEGERSISGGERSRSGGEWSRSGTYHPPRSAGPQRRQVWLSFQRRKVWFEVPGSTAVAIATAPSPPAVAVEVAKYFEFLFQFLQVFPSSGAPNIHHQPGEQKTGKQQIRRPPCLA